MIPTNCSLSSLLPYRPKLINLLNQPIWFVFRNISKSCHFQESNRHQIILRRDDELSEDDSRITCIKVEMFNIKHHGMTISWKAQFELTELKDSDFSFNNQAMVIAARYTFLRSNNPVAEMSMISYYRPNGFNNSGHLNVKNWTLQDCMIEKWDLHHLKGAMVQTTPLVSLKPDHGLPAWHLHHELGYFQLQFQAIPTDF